MSVGLEGPPGPEVSRGMCTARPCSQSASTARAPGSEGAQPAPRTAPPVALPTQHRGGGAGDTRWMARCPFPHGGVPPGAFGVRPTQTLRESRADPQNLFAVPLCPRALCSLPLTVQLCRQEGPQRSSLCHALKGSISSSCQSLCAPWSDVITAGGDHCFFSGQSPPWVASLARTVSFPRCCNQ